MDIESPPSMQHPKNLFHDSARLVEVMQHTVGIYIVEAIVSEGDIPPVSMDDLRKASDSFARQADMFGSYVNPHSDGTVLGKLEKVTPASAANL